MSCFRVVDRFRGGASSLGTTWMTRWAIRAPTPLGRAVVEFYLVQAVVAGGHFLGADWAAELYEAELGHAQDVAVSLQRSKATSQISAGAASTGFL